MIVRFELELRDRVSGGARDALGSLQRLDRSLRGLDSSLNRIDRGMERAGGSSRSSGLAFGALAVGALAAAAAIGRIGFAVGRSVIELAAFRESSLVALETVMGSAEGAQRAFGNAIQMANQTPLDTRDVVSQYQRFAVAGFGEREIAPLVAASADLGSAFGRNASDSFALVASQVRSAGKANRGDLTQALNAGVNTGGVLDSIARQMNIQGADERARRANVLDALSKGRVTGDTFIQGMFDSISARMDRGGPLGTFAKRQSETLTGALSNAANAWENLLLSFGSERLPGVIAFRDSVLAVTSALDGTKPAGAALRGLVSDVINVLGTELSGLFSAGNISGFADTIESVRPVIVDVVRGVIELGKGLASGFAESGVIQDLQAFGADGSSAETFREVGRAFGFLGAVAVGVAGVIGIGISGIVEAVDFFRTLPEVISGVENELGIMYDELVETVSQDMAQLPEAVSYLGDEFEHIATDMVDGFIAGLDAQWGRVTARVTELSDGVVNTVRGVFDMHSPSRVMMELGAYTAEGFAMGVDGGAGRVGRSMGDMASGGADAAAGAMGSGSGGVQIQLQVMVQATPGADPEETGHGIGRGIVAELAGVFELLNLGPAPGPS